jgi:hypothetical protein
MSALLKLEWFLHATNELILLRVAQIDIRRTKSTNEKAIN